VSVDVERQLYDAATRLGITIVTASQRPALISYHSQVRPCLLELPVACALLFGISTMLPFSRTHAGAPPA
jgi:hypothetical protein